MRHLSVTRALVMIKIMEIEMIFVLVAAVGIHGMVDVELHKSNSTTLELCANTTGSTILARKTEAIKNAVCWDSNGQIGIVNVLAYVQSDNQIKFYTSVHSTAEACGDQGHNALQLKGFPGA